MEEEEEGSFFRDEDSRCLWTPWELWASDSGPLVGFCQVGSGDLASRKLGTHAILAWLVELRCRREVNVSLMSFVIVCR